MPKSKYSAKQKKLAKVAPPRDKITGADLKRLRKRGKKKYTKIQGQEERLYTR